jgi:hypothetical protein
MQFSKTRIFILLGIFSLVVLTGCSAGSNAGSDRGAAEGIERYLRALAAGDVNQLVDASCAAWEQDARLELDSFAAVSVELVDLNCEQSDQEVDSTRVNCSGKIIANYGNEVLEIALADRSYVAVYEGGEWRMCGYR